MSTLASATDALTELADARIMRTVKALIADGKAEWVWDPQVDGVLGLIQPGTNTAFLVFYPRDHDFEVGTLLEAELVK